MDTVLLTTTLVSLVLTATLGVMVVRLQREERRRSEARVRLLLELAGEPAPAPSSRYADLDLAADASSVVSTRSLFDDRETPSPWPRRLGAAAAVAVVLVLAGAGWTLVSNDAPSASQATNTAPQPLELLSLGHRLDDGALTITGIVQNPRGSAAHSHVQAAAVAFGRDGALLASASAPIDFATLPAGSESPFVIRVGSRGAARYRVSFRGADGQPLAHVDRRAADAVVRKEAP